MGPPACGRYLSSRRGWATASFRQAVLASATRFSDARESPVSARRVMKRCVRTSSCEGGQQRLGPPRPARLACSHPEGAVTGPRASVSPGTRHSHVATPRNRVPPRSLELLLSNRPRLKFPDSLSTRGRSQPLHTHRRSLSPKRSDEWGKASTASNQVRSQPWSKCTKTEVNTARKPAPSAAGEAGRRQVRLPTPALPPGVRATAQHDSQTTQAAPSVTAPPRGPPQAEEQAGPTAGRNATQPHGVTTPREGAARLHAARPVELSKVPASLR